VQSTSTSSTRKGCQALLLQLKGCGKHLLLFLLVLLLLLQ
jgi:hypothetical protein